MTLLVRFVTALKNIPDEEELQYTTDMIYENFSNYSAWHNRRYILMQIDTLTSVMNYYIVRGNTFILVHATYLLDKEIGLLDQLSP